MNPTTHPAHQDSATLIGAIKAYRQRIDTMINSTKLLKPSREISLAYTNLQRTFSFLGKALGALGSISPYSESTNPQSKVIEPTAEHSTETFAERWKALDHTAQVKDFRGLIADQRTSFGNFIVERRNDPFIDIWFMGYLNQSFYAFEEANIWLAWELAKIRDAAQA